MVFAIDPRDISRRVWHVRVLLAFLLLLVQHWSNRSHEPPRIQSDRRADGLGRI